MPRVITPLTDATIKKAKPKAKEYRLPDGNHLYLRIRPSGVKTFVLIYNSPISGKRQTMTIGEYPTITLKMARMARDEALRLLAQGIDPIQQKKKEKQERQRTFKKVVEEFLEYRQKEVRPNTYDKDKGRIENYILPFFGDFNPKDITNAHLEEFVSFVQNRKLKSDTKSDNKKKDTIYKLFSLLSLIYKFALNKQYVERNPIKDFNLSMVIGKKEEKHHQSLTRLEEIRTFLEQLQKSDFPLLVKLAIEFQILTALRIRNVVSLKWSNIDFDNKIISFSSDEMKTAKKHRIPITPRIEQILHWIKKQKFNSFYVFASDREKKHISDATINKYIKTLNKNISSHGFRGTFRTIASENMHIHGFSIDVIKAQLAHNIGNKVDQAYLKTDFLEQRRQLMEWYEALLLKDGE